MKVRVKPAGVYMKWSETEARRGREVIWRKGWNDNRICAHSGFIVKSVEIDSWLAIRSDRSGSCPRNNFDGTGHSRVPRPLCPTSRFKRQLPFGG